MRAGDPEVVIREHEFTPSTFNDPTLANLGADVFRRVVGAENVVRAKPVMGGEDFGRFAAHAGVPGFNDTSATNFLARASVRTCA